MPTTDETPRDMNREYSSVRKQLIILGLLRFSEALAWSTIFPYAFAMMQSLLPAPTPSASPSGSAARDAKAAALASATVSLFTFGEFLTSVPWTKISDRIGRKPTLLIGAMGGCVSACEFGFSRSVVVAVGARLFGGLVNPNVGVVAACVAELVEVKSLQGKAFSIVPFLRGLGSLIGPVIGGYLAEPVKVFPSLFPGGTVFEAYPYLLPNLIVTVCTAGSGVLVIFFLEETHPDLRNQSEIDPLRWVPRRFKALLGQGREAEYQIISSSGVAFELQEATSTADVESSEVELPSSPGPDEAAPCRPPPWSRQVMLQISALSILAFHKVSSDVIIPIFLATDSVPAEGSLSEDKRYLTLTAGFGMAPPSISNVLLVQATAAVLAQLLIVPWVITRWGALRSFCWSTFVFPWLYCLTPFTATLIPPLSMITLILDLLIKSLLVNIDYVASAILIANTSPAPVYLATINGAAASLSCLARSVGAAVSGSMFHQGLKVGNIGLPFWTLAGVAALGAVLSCFLRDEP